MGRKIISFFLTLLICANIIPAGGFRNGGIMPEKGAIAQDGGDGENGANGADIRGGTGDSLPEIRAGNPKAGQYVLRFSPLGKGFSDYYDMVATVWDAEENLLGRFPMSGYGTDPWAEKTVDAFLENDPATLKIEVMYKYGNYASYEGLTYEHVFEDVCQDRIASAASAVDPENTIDFCKYSIECIMRYDGTCPGIFYVDAGGGTHYQEKCLNLSAYQTNVLTDANDPFDNDGWYCLRSSHMVGEHAFNGSFYIGGNVNLILCDGSALECLSFILEDNSSLTIWQQRGGTGSLKVKGEKVTGIGVADQCYPGILVETGSSLTINGGNIYATGQLFCAAIGGGKGKGSGAITINGGTVFAVSGDTDNSSNRRGPAAIGGGGYGGGTNEAIVINGGNVTARLGGVSYGAAIGCGESADGGPVTINGGTIKTEGTIGGSGSSGKSGPVTINGGDIESTGSMVGIGGFRNGPITITGGNVKAYSTYIRAAIGATVAQEDPIIISGGTVLAICSASSKDYPGVAAAIGGGHCGNGGIIRISGKDTNVIAISEDGAGIGSGGANRDINGVFTDTPADTGGEITIDDGFVFAMSTKSGAGIGGGNGSKGGTVTINGGYVIGYGGSSSYNWFTDGATDTQGSGAPGASDDLINSYMESYLYDLIADAILNLIFSNKYSAAGIGGGSGATGGTVRVNGGVVVARGGTNECSAVGWGKGATGVTLDIYENAKVTYGNWNGGSDAIIIDGWTTGADKEQKARDNAYAKIEPGPVSVVFDVCGHGVAPAPQLLTMGDKATRPEDPAAEGFIFGGWYKTNAFTELFDFDEPVMRSTTVYARWLKSFKVTVKKTWPDGAELLLPASVTINYANEISEEKTENGTLTLTAENGWTAEITVSEISILTLTEENVEGFVADGWTLTCGEDPRDVTAEGENGGRGKAVLDLRDIPSLNLSGHGLAALTDGEGLLTLANKKAHVYTVEKKWEIPQDNYRPETVSAVLQHLSGNVWETLETVDLNSENGWKAEFSPLPETAGMDAEYRVRELDSDGNPVLAATDEGGAEEPSVTYRIEPWTDTQTNMEYKVTYEAGTGESARTVITNSAGEYYYVKVIFKNADGSEADKPGAVGVTLFRDTSSVDVLMLNGTNGWEGIFEGQMESGTYIVREQQEDGTTVYVEGDNGPSGIDHAPGKAVFTIEKEGKKTTYEYDVTVEVSEDGRRTVITNTVTGVIFHAKKVWETEDGSPWPWRVYRVSAVLQRRITGENGEVSWVDVDRISLGFDFGWRETPFVAVAIDGNFNEDDFRVREFIENCEFGNGSDLKIDAGTGDGQSAEGRLMLLTGDGDNTGGTEPHFSCAYRYIDGSMSDYEYYSAGFSVSYERGADGIFVIKNTQDGIVTVEKKWTDGDGKKLENGMPESVKAVLQKNENGEWTTVGEAAVLSIENGWKKSFDLTGELDLNDISEGLKKYRIRELDGEGNIVYEAGDSDKPDGAKDQVQFKVKADEDGEELDVYFEASYETANFGGTTVITNKLLGGRFVIEKEWDIDLEKNDRPDGVEAVIQEKNGDDWETVKLVGLKGKTEEESGTGSAGGNSGSDDENEEWKVTVYLPLTRKGDDGKYEKIEYRVRELREETALEEIMGRIKDLVKQGKDKYDEWIETLKTDGKSYFDMLPDAIKEAAEQGYEQLLDKLNATPNDLYEKLTEKLSLVCSGDRIVYDKDDPEAKKDDGGNDGDGEEEEKPETNAVRFHVKEKNSVVSGGQVDAHVTKYSVEYKEEDGTFTITNKAILEIDVIKRWIGIGVDDEDMPDSAWVVLLFRPMEGAVDNASGIASAAGADISEVLDFDFPVINPEDGGRDPVSIISELVTGIDINIFGSIEVVPKLAIDKVDEDSNWTKKYVVSKYYCGIPMEYKGAELSSEIIRQIIKYLTDGAVDSPVSFNPFDMYFSIPTPAIRTLAGITDPGDFLDLSALAGKFLEKAKSLTMDDIRDFGPETLLDDWHLMANVINIKIDWDTDPGKHSLIINKSVDDVSGGGNFIFEIEQLEAFETSENGDGEGEESGGSDVPFRKLTVMISGNGSVRIEGIAPGLYKVTEITAWSWRYDVAGEASVEVRVEGESDATVTFTNALNNKNWLGAETKADNSLGSG